jgi:hypothetical protein
VTADTADEQLPEVVIEIFDAEAKRAEKLTNKCNDMGASEQTVTSKICAFQIESLLAIR